MNLSKDIRKLCEGNLATKRKELQDHQNKNKARAQEQYDMHLKHSHELLDSIKKGLSKHKGKDEDIHWGHVGTMSSYHEQLRHLDDRVNRKGEYSPVDRPIGY